MGTLDLLSTGARRCDHLTDLVRDNLPNCTIKWEHYGGVFCFYLDASRITGASVDTADDDFCRIVEAHARRFKKWREKAGKRW